MASTIFPFRPILNRALVSIARKRPLLPIALLLAFALTLNLGQALASAGPGITTQPQDQNVVFGANAIFSVIATGQTPLYYQWSFNNTNLTNSVHIIGATNATLTISNVAAADAGTYQVVVSNSHGSVTSSNAQLAVGAAPVISPPPQSQIRIVGGSVIFNTGVTGTAPLKVQWSFNNTPLADNGRITGLATSTLTISNLQTNDAGIYALKVTNAFGTASSTASLGVLTSAAGSIRYVNLNNPTAAPPYNNWTNAAITIQDAIDAANPGEEILVTNGVYSTGSRVVLGMTNRVAVTMPLSIVSANGPGLTAIDGGGVIRCVAMADGSSLTGFTITNGATAENGGGVRCDTTNVAINFCAFSGNSAVIQGGGAYQGMLNNCTLTGNSAAGNAAGYPGGGAAAGSVLTACVVNANSSSGYGMGAGLFNCIARRCYVTSNSAPQAVAGGASQSTLENCLVANNYSGGAGGGADSSTLVNCTVVDNTAYLGAGGGLNACAATNCIIYFNSFLYSLGFGATPDQTNCAGCALSHCCTWPMPTNGVANIPNAPVFVNVDRANYHLYPGSPVIDVGDNSAVAGATDLDGNPRIVNGAVDLGAYEFQNSPLITVQPAGQTVHLGEPAVSFSVVAVGPSLYYQWRFNGTNIAGATASSLTLANVPYSRGGIYSVFLTNAYGYAISDGATLTVLPPIPPAFSSQPSGQLVSVGTNIMLSASASGSPAPTYQWLFNGIPLSESSHFTGVATANLQISNAQTNDTGNYSVTASNSGGSITSAVAAVTVLVPAAIVSPPVSQAVLLGSSATFTAAVSGSSPLALQWLFNGAPLSDGGRVSGSTTTNLSISSIQTNDTGGYQLVVTNGYNSATSTVAVLTVLVPATILSPLTNQVAMVFSNATLSLNAVGSSLFVQWQKNGTNLTDGGNISGANALNLTIANPQPADSGQYSVNISNAWASASSSETLTVVPIFTWGDAIVIPPATATNVIGIGAAGQVVNADFAVRADGSVIGWGNDLYGVLDIPPDATNVVSLMAGDEQVIAIRQDGTVATWGFGGSAVPDDATKRGGRCPSKLWRLCRAAPGRNHHHLGRRFGPARQRY